MSRESQLAGGSVASTVSVLNAIRTHGASSRTEVAERTGLSKAVVSERVRALVDAGLVDEVGERSSTGGRRATQIAMSNGRAVVATVEIAMTHVRVGLADLTGSILASTESPLSMREGPEKVLSYVEEAISRAHRDLSQPAVLCGIGVGVAGPVEYSEGRTVHPPVHPDWHDQPIRDRLSVKLGVPAWVDNEVNLMALAEHRFGLGVGIDDLLVVKIGSWVGAGLISNGQLHRGAQGSAGSLVTKAGGDDIASQAELAALSGQSDALTRAREGKRPLTAQLVAELAQLGDRTSQDLLNRAAESIGSVMTVIVDFFNPSVVILAGGVTSGGDSFLARIREVVYGNALALATRDLQIVRSNLHGNGTLLGAGILALDELTSPENLPATITRLSKSRVSERT